MVKRYAELTRIRIVRSIDKKLYDNKTEICYQKDHKSYIWEC